MSRPYINFLIDRLESEFERAREEADTAALTAIRDELSRRRVTPRNSRLAQKIADALTLGDADILRQAADTTTQVNEPSAPRRDGPTSGNRQTRSRERPANGTGQQSSAQPRFRPTREQEEAVELFRTGENLKINAYAGTGKTSTLQLLAHSTGAKGQYLAFNRRIVFDSRERFPSDVNCATTHSVAFRSMAGRYSTDKLTRKLGANELVEVLGLQTWRIDRNHVLAPRSQAYLILSTIRRYCQSDKRSFLSEHVPRHGSLAAATESVIHEVRQVALRGAQHVWDRMISPADPLPLGHDGYLKAWALSEPRFPADYIMLDEAQDTNPVVLDVLKNQSAQIIYVGDKYQQIYEWRGAVNAMEEAPAPHTAHLTTSFRFGGEVAWAANRVLLMLGERRPLTGNPDRNSRIRNIQDGTVLARTNATTITACIEALDEGKRPHLVGGTDELIAMLRGVQDLKQGRPSSVPDFFGFENWQQVVEFVNSGEGEELLTFVNLVEARGEAQLLWALNRVVDEDDADVIVSTAHKAKGREWSNVRLMDDFLKSLPLKDENRRPTQSVDPAELRLLYVALTRAKDFMSIPPPLKEFLNTGALPRTEARETASSSARTSHTRSAPPPRPEPASWEPPRNWQANSPPTPPPLRPATSPPRSAQTPPPTSARQATTDAPRPVPSIPINPAGPKRPGFLRRLFGG